MTAQPMRRHHPQSVNAALESHAFEIVSKGKQIRTEIRTGRRFNARAAVCFDRAISETWDGEQTVPAAAVWFRQIRYWIAEARANEDEEDTHTMDANDTHAETVIEKGRDQIEQLEVVLGARPTLLQLGRVRGEDSDA